MAGGVPLRVTNVAKGDPHSIVDDGLDIAELCARLEIAKYEVEERDRYEREKHEREEQDAAAQLREQVRAAVQNGTHNLREPLSKHRSRSTPLIDTNKNKFSYHLPERPTIRAVGSNIDAPRCTACEETALETDTAVTELVMRPSAVQRDELDRVFLSRRNSNSGASARPTTRSAKRGSFAILKRFAVADVKINHRPTELVRPKSEHAVKRRSQLLPVGQSQFVQVKRGELTTYEWMDLPRPRTAPRHAADSSTTLVNEWLLPYSWKVETNAPAQRPRTAPKQFQQSPPERPRFTPCGEGKEGRRSWLNLPLRLKKDKKDATRVDVVEVAEEPAVATSPPRFRFHTRSHTAPAGVLSEAALRLKKEERRRKRQALTAALQTAFLPNHTLSHQGFIS
ncbi:hypothetical protein LTR37_017539 [Vermiconidia calcicola]|uniref:Uncharacterized protein n=1 Tax=Vermiconidia calcicola TaxID=1690605 RepID=A0ACC3MK04_9PEZI|nr:hypothetical protein LTR37_017539 [Vermiconidia calcicola]